MGHNRTNQLDMLFVVCRKMRSTEYDLMGYRNMGNKTIDKSKGFGATPWL